MVEVQQAEGGVDWDDPRLQSWSGDTRRGNEAWIKRAIGIETHLGFIRVRPASPTQEGEVTDKRGVESGGEDGGGRGDGEDVRDTSGSATACGDDDEADVGDARGGGEGRRAVEKGIGAE